MGHAMILVIVVTLNEDYSVLLSWSHCMSVYTTAPLSPQHVGFLQVKMHIMFYLVPADL